MHGFLPTPLIDVAGVTPPPIPIIIIIGVVVAVTLLLPKNPCCRVGTTEEGLANDNAGIVDAAFGNSIIGIDIDTGVGVTAIAVADEEEGALIAEADAVSSEREDGTPAEDVVVAAVVVVVVDATATPDADNCCCI